MNHLFSVFLCVAFFTSCSTEVDKKDDQSSNDSPVETAPNKEETAPKETVYLFKSEEDERVVEFMRCTESENGDHEWVYYTERDQQPFDLGTTKKEGFEVVYFKTKPNELYWIYGSECGFTLSDETRKTSQWYGQVSPRCANDMFEN